MITRKWPLSRSLATSMNINNKQSFFRSFRSFQKAAAAAMIKPFFSGLFLGILLVVLPLSLYIASKIDRSKTHLQKSPIMAMKREIITSPILHTPQPTQPTQNEHFFLNELIQRMFPLLQKKICQFVKTKLEDVNFELHSLIFHPTIAPSIRGIKKVDNSWKVMLSWQSNGFCCYSSNGCCDGCCNGCCNGCCLDAMDTSTKTTDTSTKTKNTSTKNNTKTKNTSTKDASLISLFVEGSLKLNWPFIEKKKCFGRLPATLLIVLHSLSMSFTLAIEDDSVIFSLPNEDLVCDIEIGSGFGCSTGDAGVAHDLKSRDGIMKLQTIANTIIHERISKALRNAGKQEIRLDLL